MDHSRPGLDLEKELTCSICTELLYQPLTLLDCLHTYCGACLKDWFSFQAASVDYAPTPPAPGTPIFTCPSCRSGRKEEIMSKYKPGQNVLPKINMDKSAEQLRAEEEDRRLMEEVRVMSLREAGVESSSLAPASRRRRAESRSRDASRDSRQPRRATEGAARLRGEEGRTRNGVETRRRADESAEARTTRQIEHQSSIRSLISATNMSERDIEREIEEFARQIQEEGILDGLDLDNIDLERDDELSRRITEAYRRRQRDRARQPEPARRGGAAPPNETRSEVGGGVELQRPRDEGRAVSRRRNSTGARMHAEDPTRSQTSSGHLEVQPEQRHRRRTASSSRTSTTPVTPSPVIIPPTTRSHTDLGNQTRPGTANPRSVLPEARSTSSPSSTTTAAQPHDLPSPTRMQRSHRPAELGLLNQSAHSSPMDSPTTLSPGIKRPPLRFTEPALSCSRCHRQNIEYGVHYNCGACAGATGTFAQTATEAARGVCIGSAPAHTAAEPVRAPKEAPIRNEDGWLQTAEDPMQRLQSGTFCDKCSAWSNGCYWRCGTCNFGDWGFCNNCVNQGRCCSHPLLPYVYQPPSTTHNTPPGSPRAPKAPHNTSISAGSLSAAAAGGGFSSFHSLTFVTRCDLCQDPIPPTQSRFHCFECVSSVEPDTQPGDYDVCVSCYTNLVRERQISAENGLAGWRRCLAGHRMVVMAFQESTAGQKRYIVQDLEGRMLGRLVTTDVAAAAPAVVDAREGGAPLDGLVMVSAQQQQHGFPPDGGAGRWRGRGGGGSRAGAAGGGGRAVLSAECGDSRVPRDAAEEYPPKGVRAFASAAIPPREPTAHTIGVSKAQGVANGLTEAIGNTPLIRLNHLSNETGCNVLGKAEFMNPGGSIKDRAALYVVKDAEERGLLRPGGTVVEGTAGNTGIGLAHVCRSRGYKLVIYMPNTQSQGKIDLLRLLGAEARRHAESLDNAVWTNQFDNIANRRAHIETTGPEIWAQTAGQVDAFTCSTGTAGTFAGITRFLKTAVLHSYITSGGKLTERAGSSITEGIGQGRVTDNLAQDIDLVDGALHISDEKSIGMVYRCLDEEGLYLGASSALNVVAAKEVAEKLGKGHTVVTVLADGAYRYADRLFSRKWLESKNLLSAIPKHLEKYIVLP
ncbi:unnamed protein product [Parascedosporium putredinis]|uniref:Cysteine synthase 1 n=1 Tax=Parascedosporium putredinis TaxID=1442378 RepID=A0A9P1H974_9PEZI|nr:unnamed protein product [Parascedosporium putredinis]CAI8000676.1 unnamed protein product [Parascedosporium putredinis]